MEIKVLLCNCKGLCDSFKAADMNTLPFAVESDLDVKYSVLHPQLCGQGGNAILEDVFKSDRTRHLRSGRRLCTGNASQAVQARHANRRLRRTATAFRSTSAPRTTKGSSND